MELQLRNIEINTKPYEIEINTKMPMPEYILLRKILYLDRIEFFNSNRTTYFYNESYHEVMLRHLLESW